MLGHSVKSVDSMKKSQNGWDKSNLELLVPSIASSWFFYIFAKTQEQTTQLLEAGFEYVLQKDDLAYFRKLKCQKT